ncbi:MAG: phage protein GemA/Gp16 family protein [Syntrophales bacterium]
MKMIEPIQIQLIHIATNGRKSSSKELTYFEADGLINYFKTLGFKIQSNYIKTSGAARRARWGYANSARAAKKAAGNVVSLPSPGQMEMIAALRAKIPWRVEDGYRRWMEKYMRIERISTAAQAERVIEGLKGLLKHTPQEG